MQSLKNILQRHTASSPMLKGVVAAEIVAEANKKLVTLFGPTINEHASAAYVKNGVLHIACLSSTVAQAIKLNESSLLNTLNHGDSTPLVKKIVYLS